MVQSHEAPAWKGRILRHKINLFVLGTFQKRRHPKNVGRSLGIGERFVMFVRLFLLLLGYQKTVPALIFGLVVLILCLFLLNKKLILLFLFALWSYTILMN